MDSRTWVEAIGIVVLTASLLLVAYEVRQSRDASLTERFATSAEAEASIRDSIAAHADVWQRGCIGEPLTDTERTVFVNLVWLHTYRYFIRWMTSRTLLGAGGEQTFVDGVARAVHRYPGFASAWRTIEFANEYAIVVGERVAELGAAPADPDPAYCGT